SPVRRSSPSAMLNVPTLVLLLVSCFLWAGALRPAAAEQPEPIVVAAVFARTGHGSLQSLPSYDMVQLAAKMVNDRGGVLGRPIKLLEFDSKSTALGARWAALQAVGAGVVAVIGPSWSSQAMVMAPILQEAGIPMIATTATAAGITGLGDYIFRVCYTNEFQAEALVRFAWENLGVRRAAILTIADDIYSETLSDEFSERFVGRGGRIETRLRYLQTAVDFGEQLAAVQAASPDLVFVPGYTGDAGLILRQARRLGLAMPFLGGDGWTGLEQYDHLGPLAGDNYHTSHWHPSIDSPASRVLTNALTEQYGEEALGMMDAGNATEYDALNLLVDAIRRAGCIDRVAIRDALATTQEFPGVSGSISYQGSRDPAKPIVVLRVASGGAAYVTRMEPR
ncbi:MAG: ABC transporter substrate-binding protein, partial [Desulfofustis sp.]|nr:ABC transporter substrate-binding protein [Desulfofustis sp.]